MKTMKNFKRRAIALLLAVLMCLSMMNLTVFAEETDAAEETNEEVYICGLEEHTHNDECYEKQIAKEPVCENEDEGHEHTDECYAPVLDCGLEEGEGAHTHTDDCFEIETKTTDKQVLTCELAESDPVEASEGHAHTDDCYTVTETRELTCELAESEATEDTEGHTHGEDCYTVTETRELTCELAESDPVEAKEGHTHGEDCYVTVPETVDEKVLKCELEESEGHKHTEDCYKTEDVLVCELVEHTHTAACYAVVKEFIDKVNALPYTAETLPEEMPQDEYDAFMADMEALLALYGEVQEVPDVDEYEAFTTAFGKVSELWDAIEGVTPETMADVDSLSKLQEQMTDGKLNNDVTVTKTIVIESDFTLDLNGHTVTYTGTTGSVFEVISGTFTLNNSGAVASVTVDNTGTVTEVTGGAIWGGKGTEGTEPHVFERPSYWKDGHTLGGAVFVRHTGTFVMNGGTLAGNTAFAGGAIYVDIMDVDNSEGAVDVPGHLYINGGVITYNTATGTGHAYESGGGCDGGGGGIWINGYAEINPTIANVEISHNKSMTNSDLGGGGIYVNNPGELRVTNAVITQNTAVGLGGGVAGCVHGKIALINSSGAAIYDNTGNGTALDLSSAWGTATDGHLAWHKNGTIVEGFVDKAQDVLGAGSVNAGASGTVVSNERFDGEMHNWIGMVTDSQNADFREITAENNGAVYGGYVLGLTAQNKNPVNPGGRSMVVISNNSSQTYGGGIGCNGKLIIGSTTTEMTLKDLSGSMTLDVYKSLKVEGTQSTMPIKAKQFTFALVDENGVQIPGTETATNDASGKVTLHYGPVLKKENDNYKNSYEFYVKETGLTSDSIKNDLSVYKVVVEVGKIGNTVDKTIGDFMTVHMETYGVTNTTITQVKDKDGNPIENPVSTESPAFENTWKTGSLTIDKTVVSPTELKDGELFKFRVTLEDKTGKGVKFDNAAELGFTKSGDVWTKEVTIAGKDFKEVEGKVGASVTIAGIPYGLTYTVEEIDTESWVVEDTWNVTGEVANQTIGDNNNVDITNNRKLVTLSVKKTVTCDETISDAPDSEQTFKINVRLGGRGGIYRDEHQYQGNGDYVFTLKKGETANISGIPTGTPYAVTEYDNLPEGWTNTNAASLPGFSIVAGQPVGTTLEAKDADENNVIEVEVINHYFKTKTDKIEGYKDWVDQNGKPIPTELLPEFITVQLWRSWDSTGYTPSEQVKGLADMDEDGNFKVYAPDNGDSQWGYSFDNLPLYKAEGVPYTYYVKETGICYSEGAAKKLADYLNTTPGEKTFSHIEQKGDMFVIYGTGTVTDIDTDTTQWQVLGAWLPTHATENGMVIENRWLPAEDVGDVDFEVKKVDEDGKTPLSGAEFTLYTDKECTKVERPSQTTDADGIAMFSNLKPGTYYLKETKAPVGHLLNNTIWEVTVGKKALKSVEEVWSEEVWSKDDPDPESTESVPPATLEGWKNEWTWEPVSKADGSENGTAGTLTVPNARIKGDISITKAIAGGDWVNKADFANKEFKFTITGPSYPNGQEVTVKGEGTEKLENLDYGKYTITEAETEVDKYTWKGVDFGNGQNSIKVMVAENGKLYEVTATNTYTRDLGDLIIDKTVVNNTPLAADEVFKFEVELTPVAGETLPETLKDTDGNEYTVDKDGKFTVTISGIELNSEYKGNKSVTIKGIPTGTKYAVTEVDAGKWIVTSENGEGTIVSAGSKAEITNTYRPQVNTTRLSVKKVWKGDGDIERPASVTVQLYRNGQASTRNDAVQTLSASNNWSYTWTGLNENYSWSVDEVDVPEGYTREVTESGTRFTITNTYTEPEIPEDPTPLTSLLSVSKVWVGDAGENRPASVSVQFYKDGERAETVTLNDANGWSWSRVLSKEELASKWTVSEVEVPAGYTSVVTTGEDGISFTVTNTFTTTPETPDEPETPDIPDEETPKTDTPDEPVDVPDEQPPLAEIPDEQPPLVDWPPLAEIPEEQPPLVEVPEEIPLIPAEPEVVVPEEPVPMVGIPQTGDFSMVWYAVAILSALGLVVLALKKREDSKD